MSAKPRGPLHFSDLPPLSLYVHIPWCEQKCPYCDFNSHERRGRLPQARFVAALLADLDAELHWVEGRELLSIYLGGGTPSLFAPGQIARLIEGVRARVSLSESCEITMEANPGTVDRERLKGYREAGINRLSIGVQSFDDAMLRALGRIHDHHAAILAIEGARAAGFERINLDLIHTLPGQTAENALADLRTALEFDPGHLSWYQLTIEPNTAFYSNPPALPDEATQSRIDREGAVLLANRYRRYEISAFARPGHESVHNLNYWRFGDYIGIGPGAHGKITDIARRALFRTVKYRQPARYIEAERAKLAEQRQLDPDEIPLEFLLNALRLSGGVSRTLFERRCGMSAAVIDGFIAAGRERRLLRAGTRIRPTQRGLRYLDSLLELL